MISIDNLIDHKPVSERLQAGLTCAARLVLKEYGLEEGEINIVLAGNRELQRLNRQYRGKDAPTDVLSFAMLEKGGPAAAGDGAQMLGDVYISLDKAGEQAAEAGHPLHREILILAIHGLLHLIGYDHQSEDDYEAMRKRELEILNLADQAGEGPAG